MSQEIKDFIIRLGKESGRLGEGEDKDAFVEEVLENSNFGDAEDSLEVFKKAVNGDVASIVSIRREWGLKPFV